MAFTVNAFLKCVGGGLTSKATMPGLEGVRTFCVDINGRSVTFEDGPLAQKQLEFERECSTILSRVGVQVSLSSYPAMGIKIGMFKEEGKPLLEKLEKKIEPEKDSEATATMSMAQYFGLTDESVRPLVITDVVGVHPIRMLRESGYSVTGSTAKLVREFEGLARECCERIIAFLKDPGAETPAARGGLPESTKIDAIGGRKSVPVWDVLYGELETGSLTEESLRAFFNQDGNESAVKIERGKYRLSKSALLRLGGVIQFWTPTLKEFVTQVLGKTMLLNMGPRSILWGLFSKKGGVVYVGDKIGPLVPRQVSTDSSDGGSEGSWEHDIEADLNALAIDLADSGEE